MLEPAGACFSARQILHNSQPSREVAKTLVAMLCDNSLSAGRNLSQINCRASSQFRSRGG